MSSFFLLIWYLGFVGYTPHPVNKNKRKRIYERLSKQASKIGSVAYSEKGT